MKNSFALNRPSIGGFARVFISMALLSIFWRPLASNAQEQKTPWSVGVYAGKYYDTEPAGFLEGRAGFLEQYLVAVTASKPVWQSQTLPLALEIDAMVGQQGGISSLTEIAVAPTLRWSGFPWRDVLRTDVRLAPLGISYTTQVSPLERGTDGQGSRMLNWLFIETAFSLPGKNTQEVFLRLHHRCTIYDLLNNFGANGEDFFTVGVRRRF
jgi:hypothetical protein